MRRIDPHTLPLIESEAFLKEGHPNAVARSLDDKNLSRFRDNNTQWHSFEDWPKRHLVFTCRTEKCIVEGIAYQYEVAENVDGIVRAICGRCKTQYTDMREVPDGLEVDAR